MLRNVKVKRISPGTKIAFSNIVYRKDKRNIDKQRIDTNSRFRNFCSQKNISLIDDSNIREEHLGVKKLHLNRRGNSLFAKNLLDFIENKWISESKGDITISLEDVSNVLSLDAKQVLRGIRKSNINKLVFGQLNINSLRNKFDMLSEMIKETEITRSHTW